MDESSPLPVAAQVLSERTHLVIPSLPNWVETTAEYLRQKAVLCGVCQESRSGKLMVALLEALANAIIHGNLELSSALKERGDDAFSRALAERAADAQLSSRVVDIQVEYDGERCQWVITDEGPGFDVERVLARCLSDDPEVMLASGRGILMMFSLLDAIRYDHGGRRVILTLSRPSGAEKRRTPRVPLHLPLQVAPVAADGSPDVAAASDAVSHDLTRNGIALIQEGLVAGQRIFIGIPRHGETIFVPAAVRHCRTIAAGCVQLGCEFDIPEPPPAEHPTSEQLNRLHQAVIGLLAQYLAPALPADERRAHPRVVFTNAVAIELKDRPEAITGYARDLSKGGLALITRVEVPRHTAVVALPRAGATPLRIRARVVRCNKIQEGFHDVGLQFQRLEDAAG